MQVLASQPSSVVEVSLEPGDELVTSIKRALSDAGFTEAFVLGSGEIEDAEVLTLSSATGKRQHRKLAGPADLVALNGTFGETGLELRANVACEAETGPTTLGGLLVRATVVSVQARALVRSPAVATKPAPTPVADPRPIETKPIETKPIALGPSTPAPPPPAPSAPLVTPPPAVDSSPALREPEPPRAPPPPGPPLPPKLRRADTIEIYPEEGDVVTHFAFGRCVVGFSDGERLRLQQDRDGRVREVALSMLRIEPPTVLEDGRRHWELARKN